MRLRIEAGPGEVRERAPELLRALADQLGDAPEVADALAKASAAAPRPLPHRALEELRHRTGALYQAQLDVMLEEIGAVLDRAAAGDGVAKAGGPYIGPRGGKWADPQHTVSWKEHAAPPPAALAEREPELHEAAHAAVRGEVMAAAGRAVQVGADPKTMRYVGAGGEAIIFADGRGRAYRVLRTNDPAQRREKTLVERDALEVAKLPSSPAAKYLPKLHQVDPQLGVVVRDEVKGRPGGWGTKGLRDAYETIAAEFKRNGFSAPEFKEDSFIIPEDGGPPVMVDLGFLHYRGRREADHIASLLATGDPSEIDPLDQPFAIRSLYSEGAIGFPEALRLSRQLQALIGDAKPDIMRQHGESLEYEARRRGDLGKEEPLDLKAPAGVPEVEWMSPHLAEEQRVLTAAGIPTELSDNFLLRRIAQDKRARGEPSRGWVTLKLHPDPEKVGAIRLQETREGGGSIIIHRSTKKPGYWQASRMDAAGTPWGDNQYQTLDAALKEERGGATVVEVLAR